MPRALQLLLALLGLGLTSARSLHYRFFGTEQRAREEHQIPHILHQAWPDERLPPDVYTRQETWRAHHPYWEYKLWADKDNDELVKEHYVWFQDTYANLPAAMQREACRYLYLHQFGGVYADLSTVPLHSMEALIKAHQLALASVARDASSSESLSTSWLASSRRHPFWFFTFAQVIRGSGGDLEGEGAQHNTTGALMLRRALSVYRDAEGRGVDILEPECFHANTSRSDLLQHADKPYMELAKFCNPKDQDFEKATCQSYFPSAYIVEV